MSPFSERILRALPTHLWLAGATCVFALPGCYASHGTESSGACGGALRDWPCSEPPGPRSYVPGAVCVEDDGTLIAVAPANARRPAFCRPGAEEGHFTFQEVSCAEPIPGERHVATAVGPPPRP